MYQEQKRSHFERNWANEIIELRDKYSLIQTEDQIRSMTKHQWKSIADEHINKFVHSSLYKQAAIKSKTKMILQSNTLQRQQYIQQLPPHVVRRAFEVRLGMLEIKENYKNKYKDNMLCRKCKEENETLKHIFECTS